MNKKSIVSIASILFVLLITVTTCTLFLTPSPSYAEEGSVCWDCFDWGHGFEECGMEYSSSTGCPVFGFSDCSGTKFRNLLKVFL